MKVSLAKALKLKNRLAGRLNKVVTTINSYNSVTEGNQQVDIRKLDFERAELVAALVELKTAICDANRGIYKSITLLQEKKGEIEFLNSLPIRQGKEVTYNGVVVTYVATITKSEVDERVKKLEKEIDLLQDEIDYYNAQPDCIKLGERLVELAS